MTAIKNEIPKDAMMWYLLQYFITDVLSLFRLITELRIIRLEYPATGITINAVEGTILKREKYIKLINITPISPDSCSDWFLGFI